MKLTRIAIEGKAAGRQIQIERLGQSLNLIYFANGVEKDRFKSFVQYTLFGSENCSVDSPRSHEFAFHSFVSDLSFIEAQHGSGVYRVSRDSRTGIADNVIIKAISQNGSLPTLSQMLQGLSLNAFESLFNVSLNQTNDLIRRLIDLLQVKFGVRPGESAHWNYHIPYATWKVEAESRVRQLETLRSRQGQLSLEKQRLQGEIDRIESDYVTRVRRLDDEIDAHERKLAELRATLNSIKSQLTDIDRSIVDLRLRIEEQRSKVQPVPYVEPLGERLPLLYERLDELDQQIRRWRFVQADVHNQRVRLRDEMAMSERLTLDSEQHPYFVSRELVVALEAKVDTAEAIARKFEPQRVSGSDALTSERLVQLCSSMRDDLYSLCQELGRQYRFVRHRAAVAEMKQLRRCYREMDENIKLLMRRREQTLEEIRGVDPAGAEAICLADAQFCHCAEHEGYYEARRRFVGPVRNVTQLHQVYADTSKEESELNLLEQRRQTVLADKSVTESRIATLEVQYANLSAERNRIESSNFERLRTDLLDVNNQWMALDQEVRELIRLIELDRQLAVQVPDRFMAAASECLMKLTGGRLSNLMLDQRQSLVAIDGEHQTRFVHDLDRDYQDLVCLAVIVTAIRNYAEKGVRLPIIIDHLFFNLKADQREAAMLVLWELSRQGHQVLALTNDRSVLHLSVSSERLRGLEINRIEFPVSELADSNIFRPYAEPRTSPRTNHPDLPNPDMDYYGAFESYLTTPQVNPKPKYARSQPTSFVAPTNTHFGSRDFREFSVESRLDDCDLVESIYLSPLQACGIVKVRDLLALDPENLSSDVVRKGFLADQIDRWQAHAWLLVSLPELRASDARVLVACGISEPEQLEVIDRRDLLERIKRFLGSADGRRAGVNLAHYDLSLIEVWQRSLRSRRNQWYHADGYGRHRFRARSAPSSIRERDFEPSGQRYDERVRRETDRSSYIGKQNPTSNGRQIRQERVIDQGSRDLPSTQRFFLEISDDIEAAPSIGAKTAERFYKIGINSVGDFLKEKANVLAAKLNYKRITEEVISSWQQQTRLMVQIPNMRVHDVQVLVACGLINATEIAKMDPKKLLAIVEPFVESKDGERVLRGNKKPDLQEVGEWIESARYQRALQAA
ncbi:MAG TPA: DUF4332 domain-containing protein [Pirellulaceae bacterium]|nr:DUF4332 domain-containing protein [Pirellulaceae bacterium]HMO93657.1 DUF4332 domain-containing protein [Pirellulaceae bacterium]HMP70661.1 DUF4332 domain-containing protein [Pirellulaceae bacterium]